MEILNKAIYNEKIKNSLKEKLALRSIMQVPLLEKITINVGLGKAKENKNLLNDAQESVSLISGQKPLMTIAKNSIAGFKLREGMPIGVKVTIRREKMYDFLTRLTNVYAPRIKDFKGYSVKSFDNFGNYTLGINDMRIFPEISPNLANTVPGLAITFCIKNGDKTKSKMLLEEFGFIFQEKK